MIRTTTGGSGELEGDAPADRVGNAVEVAVAFAVTLTVALALVVGSADGDEDVLACTVGLADGSASWVSPQ